MFIDAHTHLYDAEFDEDLSEVIQRAKEAGVKAAQVVAIQPSDCTKILELQKRFPEFCLPGFGIHPVQDLDEMLPWIEEHHSKLVCIGEVGLDFTPHWCKTDEDKRSQREVLLKQVYLARKYDLPLNVHSRSAGRPTIALLKEAGAESVLMHAFDGRPAYALDGVSAGYFFSVPPSIIRGDQMKKLVQRVPLEKLILETDSPALGPEKQVRNEPANIRVSCECIADIKGLDVDIVAQALWKNTLKLFPRIKLYMR
ncbi:hypothetical protein CAPTEDRAFT_210491 [Capitella teleta]|uniref:TatD related DNase n=1 Tax=Capitella teleta TaxID=283909 RepID=R7VF25_CAPTE|nr:hypothetical protein CAPTEDRAFT_210491 [Capitella teleta]|eukprot:ELU17204.1 hypothetical protein CAPTEDRAFT_210491 [Capitella teleta]